MPLKGKTERVGNVKIQCEGLTHAATRRDEDKGRGRERATDRS